ncbi:hypothetical protein Lfu02_72500 [Longispora fulva]|uniref:Alpha-galactosidase n=1 Tax=Longispora fulva TaxID=619741 RepID=A0A8J7G8Z2_9ACTN|nr:NPCBM/NEW2 domain-containing protein [Longispora fulva]MBG6133839.1 alpha-galactosidase [Longispora fulva]GIG62878.1 hypothetical protein Lfu02_72500 [Longispora fulva]
MRFRKLSVLTLLAGLVAVPFAPAGPAAAADNGLALTPPMGFNNWNTTRCGTVFNETTIRGIADKFVSAGLKAAGYQYVNLDDCWAVPDRDAQGNLVTDSNRFPSGIKALADYVHSKGLKFGIYTSAGTRTCTGTGPIAQPGSVGHETQDANLFASWGVDYLKYDNCGDHQGLDEKTRFTTMRDALAATGRPIVFSVCEWGDNAPWDWAPALGNLWRTTHDITDSWSSMIGNARQNSTHASIAGPGGWNDPDMMQIGNGGMTDTEYRTHFSLWAAMASPLLIGSDIRNVSTATLNILTNADVIAVDQDSLGKQGAVIRDTSSAYILSKQLANGDRAVTLTNLGSSTATISTTATEIGLGGSASYSLKDLWSKATTTSTGAISASVPAHGTVMYRITGGALTPPPSGTSQLSTLPWSSSTNGWGPVEKDKSNGEQAAGDGRTLTINGTTYAKGLGTHAASEVDYYLAGSCSTLTVDVGVDDESTASGSVVFQVYRDTTKVADSGKVTYADAAKHLTANLAGGQQLRLVVTDAGDGVGSDHADWASPTITCGPSSGPGAGTHPLSDLATTNATNGWGPVEKDKSNGEQAAGDGKTLTIQGVTYAKGLGTHAASDITYNLAGTCTSLTVDVGVDDEAGNGGSVAFQIYRDTTLAASTAVLTGTAAAQHLTADMTGGQQLRLVVTNGGDNINNDHADWANPVLTCS